MIRILAFLMVMAIPAYAVETEYGNQVQLRALDKISGEVVDLNVISGGSGQYGRLKIDVAQCRFPRANPSGDAFAYLVIHHEGHDDPVFAGWMIASSPALNAFDHHRYDVWLLRCTTS